jgi:DNA-binding CsgD family transcriptional regulator
VLASELDGVRASGRGRLVLVAGEAGIGKSVLVEAFCARFAPGQVLWGACDALLTPRPIGPLVDIAAQTGGELLALVEGEASPSDLVAALARLRRDRAPLIVVLEDLHWADDATLDVVRLLARRCAALGALVVATYRDDELNRVHPLRVVLGEMPRSGVRRILLEPLSRAAVERLAAPARVDAAILHERTNGNPFFVTEALGAGGVSVPETVRDAVLARAARLDAKQRELLDAVAILPVRAELWLLETIVGDRLAELEGCLASGMLRGTPDTVSFRHEIARVAVEDALPADLARALHRHALAALAAPLRGRIDLARVAHHAAAAGDADAVLRYAPQAGEQAAALRAHREAAAQYARALRFADGLSSAERAALLERRSYECYLTDSMDAAIAARQAALSEYRACGDRLREGDAHRWLSRLQWFAGNNPAAEQSALAAIDVLDQLPAGREQAMAYSNMAQLRMLAGDLDCARAWGSRAIELAERLGESEIFVHALTNVGTAELSSGLDEGERKLERALQIAVREGLEEHVARAHTNLACLGVEAHNYALASRHLEAGIDYCRDHDLDAWGLYMLSWQARFELERGRWAQAAQAATAVLARPGVAATSRITALAILGRLRARRGDPDPWTPLDEATRLAAVTGEAQRLLPVALARAETRWLGGEPHLIATETDTALEAAISRGDLWASGELLLWRRRAGLADQHASTAVAEPLRLELEGEYEHAAKSWVAVGNPYEAALALIGGDSEQSLRNGLAQLQQLGATRTAAHAARKLRRLGARDMRQGPRPVTRANPAGLTRRELEVLDLLAAGTRNAQIAEQLVLSRRTVDHHVSAIMRKLAAVTRTEAVARAAELGIIAR